MKLTLGEFYTFFKLLDLSEGDIVLKSSGDIDPLATANRHLPRGISIRNETECDGMNTWTMYIFKFDTETSCTWFQLKFPMTKL